MTSYLLASPAFAMVDGSKGSMTNRAECATEHFKNNVKGTLFAGAVAATTVGVTTAASKKPLLLAKMIRPIGKGIAKIANKLNLTNVATAAKKHPVVAGAIALGTVAAAAINLVEKSFVYKAGQIDQKYTDAAKIESQTKNVVLA